MNSLGHRQLVVWAMVVLAWLVTPAMAQPGGVVESFGSTTTSLDRLMAADGDWARGTENTPYGYEMTISALSGVTLQHNFSESVVSHKQAILDTGLRQDLVDSLSVQLSPKTRLGFSREVSSVRDLTEALLSGTEKKTLSLAQSFGAGDSSGTFEYKKIDEINLSASDGRNRLASEMMSLQSGFGKGYNVAAKLATTDSHDPFGLHQRTEQASIGLPAFGGTAQIGFSNFQEREGIHSKQVRKFDAALPLALSGGEGKVAFSEVDQTKDGRSTETRTTDILALLAMFGGQAKADYRRITTTQNSQHNSEQTLDFEMPLEKVISGAHFTHKIQQIKPKKKPAREVRLSALETPWKAFGGGGELALRRTTTRVTDKHITDYNANLTTQLEGQPLSVQLRQSRTTGDASSKSDLLKVDMPKLSLLGEGTIEYDINVSHKNGKKTTLPMLQLVMPLDFVANDARLVHTIQQVQRKKKPTQEVRKTILELPLDILSTTAQLQLTWTSIREPGDYQIVQDSRLSVPLAGESLKLTRRTTKIPGEGDTQHKRQTIIDLPKFKLFTNNANITAKHVISQIAGKADQRTTNIDIEFEPMPALKLLGNYCLRDQGVTDSRERRVFSSWNLSKDLSLNALFHQIKQASDPASIVRNLYLTKKSSSDDLSIRAGYTTWSKQGDNPKAAKDIRVSLGDRDKLNITAQLTEYDEKKWQRFAEPVLNMALQRGEPSDFFVKLEYEDHAKRASAMRGIKMAFPALGGDLKISAADNPLGTDGKTVQPAHLYTANLKRQLFGGLNLDIGYRYWNYKQTWPDETTKQYLHFQIEGGKEDGLGKLMVGFRSGSFVPQPKEKKEPRPVSLTDLKYARTFGNAGRVSLALHQPQFATPNHKLQESIECELQYGHLGISYKAGVAAPCEKGQKVGPGSILSVTYEDQWSDESRMVLTLHRTTPPESTSDITRSIRGRVEYTTVF